MDEILKDCLKNLVDYKNEYELELKNYMHGENQETDLNKIRITYIARVRTETMLIENILKIMNGGSNNND